MKVVNSENTVFGGSFEGNGRLDRRFVILMGARLGLALLSFGLVLAFDATAGSEGVPDRSALYGTVAFAFFATVTYGLIIKRVKHKARFAALNLAMDFAVVTALVQFSGGTDSALTFLYVLVAVYGAVLFSLRGAAFATCLGALSYGVLLFGGSQGWFPPNSTGIARPPSVLFTLWMAHVGALIVATSLGRVLSFELRKTGEALSRRTSDFNELLSLHRRTVESLMSGLLTTDKNDKVTSFNPEAERITGVSSANALGSVIDEILPGVWDCIGDGVGEAAARNRARMPFLNGRGEDLFLGVAAYVLKETESEPSGHVIIFQDVTDVVAMEEDLSRSERLAAVGELSASIAHEIRNPLAAISGSIQMLEKGLGAVRDDGDNGRLMNIVLRETDRLNQLIGDFLHYARPGPIRIETVNVRRIAEEVLESFEGARPVNVRTEISVDPELEIRADAGQLSQVLWNLVLNGAQAMPDGGLLTVSARSHSASESQEAVPKHRKDVKEKTSWVEISVGDEGVGIEAEVLGHIFDPFFTTKSEGSGLGLPTVHRIVERHGGVVRVESRVGLGTVIRIRMPGVESV